MSERELSLQAGEAVAEEILLRREEIEAKKKRPLWFKFLLGIVPWVVSLALWGTVAAYGYQLMQNVLSSYEAELAALKAQNEALEVRIDAVNTSIREQNDRLSTLSGDFEKIKEEMVAVQKELTATGGAIQKTDASRQALIQQINTLASKLDQLSVQIKKLEDAARMY
ncbi:MAG: hypothetical protein IMX04_05365 [Candidatus Carbobacillus altaicus]|uniref:Uncharacterized protein n=1 Tax=Candidatus Carbonibacillus altaicus TaxID=2163959 RepID=A0A2R6Y570_9BACL|nr:hypothetical protein [Candidatus Carbobacillus altaicus]PTQ57826.1 MAG: hypothetical protein BSOLF_0688 [Candidatus Carbobacillus altaicus]